MKTISIQLINYFEKMNKFYGTRINSIHHGHIRVDVVKGLLYSQELYIHDHMQKSSIPPKPINVNHLERMMEIIEENEIEYDKASNGFFVFFIRNWKIYKHGVHTTVITGNPEGEKNE